MGIGDLFYKLPKEHEEIFSKATPLYGDKRAELAKEILASGNAKAIDKSAEVLAKTVNKLTESGASQTYCLESMVECANAMITLGKPSVKHVLWVLDQQKDRPLYLFSQRAQLIMYQVLQQLHDVSAIPKLKSIIASTKASDHARDMAAKQTLEFLELVESTGLG